MVLARNVPEDCSVFVFDVWKELAFSSPPGKSNCVESCERRRREKEQGASRAGRAHGKSGDCELHTDYSLSPWNRAHARLEQQLGCRFQVPCWHTAGSPSWLWQPVHSSTSLLEQEHSTGKHPPSASAPKATPGQL